jgi:hypothetical protein
MTSGSIPATNVANSSAIAGKLPVMVWIYLLTVVLPIGFWAGPLFMTTLRLLLLVATVPLMINILRGKYGKVYLTDILFVGHILWAAIAIWANNPDRMIQQVGSVGIEFLGGYAIGRAFIRTREDFAALCRTLVLLVLCTLPFSLYETMTGRPIIVEILRKVPGFISVPVVNIDIRLGLERVQSVFAHPIHYGLFCSVALSLCLVALKGAMSTTRRLMTGLIIAGCGFLALSSGALTAIALQFFFIIWAAMFKNFKQRWWLLVGLFVFGYIVVDILSNRSPLKVFMSYATFSAHNAYWRSIIFDWGVDNIIGSVERGIPASPMFGIGLNDWIRPSFMHSGSMDNFWLVIGVRYGLPGLLLLALGYVIVIVRVMRRQFDGDESLILFRRAWVFTFLGLTFTLCTVHVWTNIYSFIFFMFGAGVWFIAAELNADQTGLGLRDSDIATRVGTGNSNPYTRFPSNKGVAERFTRTVRLQASKNGLRRKGKST